ncbi:hypothetical protein [Lyngbya sp. CCY1209]|uniref:hypothetical protein n=1 Tax=Lyngbya sp. CCY1209 TaxID=2886103 RepID=UPI002D1FD7B3|nr:hypothetical protein [Lyngbya sp. CCY1209]MEB3885832.1 hypothetical protein [Lyngbya sp. CCY1209]
MEFWKIARRIAIGFWVGTVSIPAYAAPEPSELRFRGTVESPTQIGAEYIVFTTTGNNEVRGLVYTQNSDNGSCFEGVVNPPQTQIRDITYAHPVFGNETTGWEVNVSERAIALDEFPHPLNASEISDGAREWLGECLELEALKSTIEN